MKITKHIYIMALAGLAVASAGCKKYLDQSPDQRTQLNSTEKVAQLLVSAYPKADHLAFTEKLSDNSEDKGPRTDYFAAGSANSIWAAAYFWGDLDNTGDETGSIDSYWAACYLAIASANTALEYMDKHPDDATLKPYRGEALVARAYAHFMLVTLFAKNYQIGGANTSAGIPYVITPETVVQGKYNRGTVASTYESIEKDFLEGFALLKNSAYKVPKYHFTIEAASAFAARFYLYKGDYEKVKEYAGKVLSTDAQTVANLRPWNSTYYNMVIDAFTKRFTESSVNSNLLLGESSSVAVRTFYDRYGLGQTVMATVVDGPNVSGGRYAYRNFNREPYYSLLKFQELFFETKIGSGVGEPYIMMPLLTTDELLMNRAEAYASSNQYDLALRDINLFLSTRILNYSAGNQVTLAKIATFYKITDPKEGLIKTILDLKRAEFIEEGIRWFDLVRHNLTVTHLILDVNGKKSFIELKPDDPRRLLQLPKPVERAGLALNPR